jgi:hypothetical protein
VVDDISPYVIAAGDRLDAYCERLADDGYDPQGGLAEPPSHVGAGSSTAFQ